MFLLLAKVPGLPVDQTTLLYAGGALGGFVFIIFVIIWFQKGTPKDPEEGLEEKLSALPPPPAGERHYQLKVVNQPVRLRLVVIAPVGKRTVGKPEAALEEIYRGLGEVSMDDKPRVRIWPPQLSVQGFAPTFFRKTEKPEPEGKPSRWILLAGPAKAGGVPVLLGMAVLADKPSTLGLVTMTETEWGEVLSVETS
jgi:hypothetical protein